MPLRRERSAWFLEARSAPQSPWCTNESARERDLSMHAAPRRGVATAHPSASWFRTRPEGKASCLAISLPCLRPPDLMLFAVQQRLREPFVHAPARHERGDAVAPEKLPVLRPGVWFRISGFPDRK